MIYSVRMDGFEIGQIDIPSEDCLNQSTRDAYRREYAKSCGVPVHYLRLSELNKRGATYVFRG